MHIVEGRLVAGEAKIEHRRIGHRIPFVRELLQVRLQLQIRDPETSTSLLSHRA